ncbi:unnamed protein product [Effrenium voratum]|nr:unnamed protein product [Effrenium voratum]
MLTGVPPVRQLPVGLFDVRYPMGCWSRKPAPQGQIGRLGCKGGLTTAVIMFAISRQHRPTSETLWIRVLENSAKSLRKLAYDLKVAETEKSVETIESSHKALHEVLKHCPWGDPSATAAAPSHISSDPLVQRHRETTRAMIDYELSRIAWMLQRAEDDELRSSLLARDALQRLRTFDIEGAHASLTTAYRLHEAGQLSSAFDHGLLEYTWKLLAARDFTSSGSDSLPRVKEQLNAARYTEDMVLWASGVSSLTEFVLRKQAIEAHLAEWCLQDNHADRSVLRDLIKLFLLHAVMPVKEVHAAIGAQACQILMDHGVLCSHYDSVSVFASVALWPVGSGDEALLLATDFESSCFSGEVEPVMYLSEDSLALFAAAPRATFVEHAADLCCGCGIQGLLALKTYARRVTFVDVNPRCLSFTAFNLATNGLTEGSCLRTRDICADDMEDLKSFDAILVNPPFMPNPKNIATGASLLYGNGGDDGERVLSSAVAFASHHLSSQGYMLAVSKAPNAEELPARLRLWTPGKAILYRGPAIPAGLYMPTAASSGVEPVRYQQALSERRIHSLSQTLLCLVGSDRRDLEVDIYETKDRLWLQTDFLKGHVRRKLEDMLERGGGTNSLRCLQGAPYEG